MTAQCYKPTYDAIVEELTDSCHGLKTISKRVMSPENRALIAVFDPGPLLTYSIGMLSNLIQKSEIPTQEIPRVIATLQEADQKLNDANRRHIALEDAIKNLQSRL